MKQQRDQLWNLKCGTLNDLNYWISGHVINLLHWDMRAVLVTDMESRLRNQLDKQMDNIQ